MSTEAKEASSNDQPQPVDWDRFLLHVFPPGWTVLAIHIKGETDIADRYVEYFRTYNEWLKRESLATGKKFVPADSISAFNKIDDIAEASWRAPQEAAFLLQQHFQPSLEKYAKTESTHAEVIEAMQRDWKTARTMATDRGRDLYSTIEMQLFKLPMEILIERKDGKDPIALQVAALLQDVLMLTLDERKHYEDVTLSIPTLYDELASKVPASADDRARSVFLDFCQEFCSEHMRLQVELESRARIAYLAHERLS
jgi:hypothetical protein